MSPWLVVIVSGSMPVRGSPVVGGVPTSVRLGSAAASCGVQVHAAAASVVGRLVVEPAEQPGRAEHDQDEGEAAADARLDLALRRGVLRLAGEPPLGPSPLQLALAVALWKPRVLLLPHCLVAVDRVAITGAYRSRSQPATRRECGTPQTRQSVRVWVGPSASEVDQP